MRAGLTSKVKVSSKTILGNLLHLRASVRANGLAQKYVGDEPPLRSELFSSDQMEQHGKTLAGSHQLSLGRAPDQLLARLTENEAVLIGVRNLLTEAVTANHRITPAGEWLLDNFYLIEEQIRTAKRHLPKGYNRELPSLLNGPSRNGTTKSTAVGQIAEGVDDVARFVEGRRSDGGEQRSQPAERHGSET